MLAFCSSLDSLKLLAAFIVAKDDMKVKGVDEYGRKGYSQSGDKLKI